MSHVARRFPEAAWLALLLAGVLAVNLGSGTRSPAVWIDEAAYCDPAVNLYLGNGFVSSAWYAQGDDEIWAGNVPLYPLAMVGWLHLFGTSILAVRSLNYVLFAISAALIWAATGRLRLVRSPRRRLAMIALILCGFGVCFNYRTARPDCLCILLASTALLAASIPRRPVRLAAIGVLGVLFPVAGLQLVVFAAILGLLLLVFLKGRYLPELLVLGAGCVAGATALWLVYSRLGVWDAFVASTAGAHSALGRSGEGLARLLHVPGGLRDPSYLLLLLTVLGLAVAARFRGSFCWRSPLGFGVAAGVAIPLAMHALRGQFPCYYSWMAYVPMCVGLSAALSASPRQPSSRARRLAVPALLTAAACAGLPFVTVLTLCEWHDRDYTNVQRLVARHVRPGDCVYHDGSSYFAVKGRATSVAGWRRLAAMSADDRARVNVLVVRPGTAAQSVERRIGGRWEPCGRPLCPARPPWFGVPSEYFLDKYHLQVYRRVAPELPLPALDTFADKRTGPSPKRVY